ncbi:N-acetylmuramoyl-L-alanine amidase [Lacticaseibacillus manihotivorans]|uniref:N-acetylmuramoyl-L-alanine amidase n=1 Tax=Lacticaseibacillus manihotivorans TaxID=88233 RepID=UPI001FB1D8C7|nr:N-acetylmuramoyl-L-alanine amidase [Lacticaseibacillus manihotivorans]
MAGDGIVYSVGSVGYVAWGAGQTANAIAPVQIEMEESSDRAKQLRIYNTTIELIRDMCKKLGIAYTFEANSYTGVQTHRHIAQMNGETSHTDPWAPLARIGKSKGQVAADIKNGVGKVTATTAPAQTPAKQAATKGAVLTNVTYDLHQLNGTWLGEVTNFSSDPVNGFAGNPNHAHDALVVKVNHGSVKYRVHTSQDGWLPYVTGYDRRNAANGFAGIMGHAIDGVQIYYTTPAGETFQQAYYRSQTTKRAGWLPAVRDDTDFAGMLGEPLDRLQIKIGTANPF